jgi:hypothetical protein
MIAAGTEQQGNRTNLNKATRDHDNPQPHGHNQMELWFLVQVNSNVLNDRFIAGRSVKMMDQIRTLTS